MLLAVIGGTFFWMSAEDKINLFVSLFLEKYELTSILALFLI